VARTYIVCAHKHPDRLFPLCRLRINYRRHLTPNEMTIVKKQAIVAYNHG